MTKEPEAGLPPSQEDHADSRRIVLPIQHDRSRSRERSRRKDQAFPRLRSARNLPHDTTLDLDSAREVVEECSQSPRRPSRSRSGERMLRDEEVLSGRVELLETSQSRSEECEALSTLQSSPPLPGLHDDSVDDPSDTLPETQQEILWTKDQLPPTRENELEFMVREPKSFRQGKSIVSEIMAMQGSFRFRLLVFPMGTETTGRPEQLAAFVEVVPPESCNEARWAFEQVRYLIAVINWKDYRKTVFQQDNFTFQRDSSDRGWHRGFLKASDMTIESGWLNEQGELCLRAACQVRRAMVHMPSGVNAGATSRRSVGYVGLKNHGATCYMNCLLQTLFHIGRFRHIVYSIDCPEAAEQAAASGDDAMDCNSNGDERPALPLLVALQNLFYRLQTSETVVSCRELMRSFGWDTADAFMQHDAQELNRLLCDRVEEQLKGTPVDGEIKRLFEGEMENYIECMNVDYSSTRMETFYDLQLNVRNDAGTDLSSLEESLRNFTCEEIMEDENAYDAGSHGKQRARKGIRFKRFPPVLHFQLKRFMFDVERLDMCKLNGRLEFPMLLNMEEFAPGSGKYQLHTVVVHSGGVSSGHYYAFVRVRDGENSSGRWLKFDDEMVTSCSEHAAVDDNYGGEDFDLWNYFSIPAQDLQERSPPKVARIHNAYMLSYVRLDAAEEILKSPGFDDEAKDRPYQRMVERCMREARLAEERKRAKVEQLMRIEVRLLFERDLTTLLGFWSHHDLPCSKKLRMSRDQVGEDLYQQAAERLHIPHSHVALFLLESRKNKQTRFKWLPPDQTLRSHLPATGAPHSFSCEPHFVVLCVPARDYDMTTMECRESQDENLNLINWGDHLRMLIVKYFCPESQRIVCLGCYISICSEALEAMLNDEQWFQERLRPFVESGQVKMPSTFANFLCWEEYCNKTPQDIVRRETKNSIADERLENGDIIIWQPTVDDLRTNASEVACFVVLDSERVPIFPDSLLKCFHVDKLTGYAHLLWDAAGRDQSRTPPRERDTLLRWIITTLRQMIELCKDGRHRDSDMEVTITKVSTRNGCANLGIEEIQRRKGLFAFLGGSFPVYTIQDHLQNMVSQMPIGVKVYFAAETPFYPDLILADGFQQPGNEHCEVPVCSGEERSCSRCGLAVEAGKRICHCGAKFAIEVRDLMVDVRWPVSTLMARIMEAFAVDAAESHLWLFVRGEPSESRDPPCFCTEDFSYDALPPTMRVGVRDANFTRCLDNAMKSVLDLPKSPAPSRWVFYAAVMESVIDDCIAKTMRPVKVHFFNNHVQEVGTCILHVPVRDEDDGSNADVSDTGRPAFDPEQLLSSARTFLEKHEKLRAQLWPPTTSGIALEKLPLRLVDVHQARIRAVASSPSHASSEGAVTARSRAKWPHCGHNFLSAPLRVEPDWDCNADDQVTSSNPAEMVEVFHAEPHTDMAFGHPCLLRLRDQDDPVEQLQAKLQVPESEMAKWRIKQQIRNTRYGTAIMAPPEKRISLATCWSSSAARERADDPNLRPTLCVERQGPWHRVRTSTDSIGRPLRAQKPLTIRGGAA